MAYEVQMPKWGLTMKTGKIARWSVQEGERVEKGKPLLEVETDKITNVVEAPESGVLLKILVAKGQTAAVKSVIAVIGEPGENVDAWTAQSQPAAEGAPKAPASKAAPAGKASASDVRAMPAARRAAKELGIDLAQVAGTGKDGAVTEKDVLAYKAALDSAPAAPAEEAGAAEPCDDEIVPMEGMRRIIADNMQASLQNAAQLTVSVDCDVTEAEELRQKAIARARKKDPGYRLSWNDIVSYAVCRALVQVPVMNSTLQEDGIHLHKRVNLGIAVSLDQGLIVPNVKDAGSLSIEELKAKVRDVAARARTGALEPDEIHGGTFTISNVSMMGIDHFTPILNPPETGILGVGRVAEKPWVHNGALAVRQVMSLSLTFNHMVTDGGPAMKFLRTLADMLEKPVRMLG
ncbi:MAG: 2-oxo acid dehydrogenase subunit E2 [Desulfovibrio sp.]|nr:2-oxo acid dehydrogenase subunit E2 [Desulfovibrio sp.]